MRKYLLASMLLGLLWVSPAQAQLVGTDTAPGSSCAGYPDGATRMTADADLNGAEVVLVCDGTNWLVAPGAAAGADRQVQFNSGGALAASANLRFTSVGLLSVTGQGLEVKQAAAPRKVLFTNNIDDALLVLNGDYPNATTGIIGFTSSSKYLNGFMDDGGFYKGAIDLGSYNYFVGQSWDVNDPVDGVSSGIEFVDNGLDFHTGIGGASRYPDFEIYSGSANFNAYGNTPTIAYDLGFRRARGTFTASTAVVGGDKLGSVFFQGRGSSAMIVSSKIEASVGTGTVGANVPGKLSFFTSPGGGTGILERMTVLSNGNVGIGTLTPGATFDAGGSIAFSSDLTPTAISASQNNYAPTGHASAGVMRLSATAPYDITGLAGGVDGRIVTLVNIGGNTITLVDEAGTSTAANRFALAGNVALATDQSAVLLYDSSSSRWRGMAVYGPASPAAGADRQVQFNSGGALSGDGNFSFSSSGLVSLYKNDSSVAGGNLLGLSSYMDVIPAAAQTAGRTTAALDGGISVGAGTQQVRAVRGINAYAGNAGTGPIESLKAVNAYAGNTAAATITGFEGGWFGAASSAGTITDMSGLIGQATVSGGTVTTLNGVLATVGQTGGSVTNRHGIYIAAPSGTATNDWGIYQAGTQNNYLGGRLGIGTSPAATRQLDVAATSNTTAYFVNSGATGTALHAFASDTSASVHYGVLAVAAGSASYGLYCQSDLNANGCGGNRAWYNASDLRLKDHIADLGPDSGLDAVMQLRPVRYQWKGAANTGKPELGFLAQDVEKVLPELVGIGPDQEITLSDGSKQTVEAAKVMSYGQMVVPLVKAVQELKAENDNLRTTVDELTRRLEKLEARAE